ncbi:MAG: zinc ABC transporter substrate-binding protein [Candidatus Thorarchaeota archaeon]|nr:MAG: zinc ABC transporter substrate-binding protein [Candidatus Thorarchaeota archaeon]
MRTWRKSRLVFLLLLVFSMIVSGGVSVTEGRMQTGISIAVTIAPLEGIVRSVGGANIETTVLLTEGVEPHAFSVDPSVISAAQDADLLVLTGHFHWEEDLIEAVSTAFITMDDERALASYEEYGAALSEMPGSREAEATPSQHNHEEGNPHSWWLLPRNAIAVANTTRVALNTLNGSLSDFWTANFNEFVAEIDSLQSLVESQDEVYGFSDMHAIVVFPAEAYVAEAFGIEVEAVLMEGGLTISGGELLQVQETLRNGSVQLILGSDVARLQAGGEFAEQLVQDYGGTLIWWRAVFFSGLNDYLSLMTYNLGALTSGLDDRGSNEYDSSLILLFGGLAGVLGIIVLVETILLVRRSRSD